MNKEPILRTIINQLPAENWQDKVKHCAKLTNNTPSTVYQWLSSTDIPDEKLIALLCRALLT